MIDSLISASINNNCPDYLRKFPEMLLTVQDVSAKKWVLDYFDKHQAMPTQERLAKTPHSIYWTKHLVSSPLTDIYELALTAKKENYLLEKWREIESEIDSGSSIPTQRIIELGNQLGSFTESKSVSMASIDRDRLYNLHQSKGIYLGFPKIDEDYGGLMPGDFCLITGRPKSYKTLSTNFIGYNVASCYEKVFNDAESMGKKVLFISGEMTKDDIAIRMDAIAGKFNSKTLRTSEDAKRLDEFKTRASKAWSIIKERGGDFIIPDLTIIRAESVLDEINKHKPDLVICDAMYRFEGEGDGWRKDARIVVDICNIARMTNTAIIGTNQLTRDATPGDISLADIAYSDAYAREPALILAMYSYEDRPTVSTIKVLASRHSSNVFGDEVEYFFGNSTYKVN